MRRQTLTIACTLVLLFTSDLRTDAADIESFEFNDSPGTSLAFAANTAKPGNQWIEDPQMFPSDVRNGRYNITLESSNLESNYLQIDNITGGTYYLTAAIAAWKFGSTLDPANLEEVRFGFLNDDTSPTFGSTITAQMTLRRNSAGDIELVGDALGTGSANIAGTATFAAIRTTPLTVALEINKTSNTYKVFYKDNTLATQVLGIGAIAPARNGNAIRFATNNSFGEGNTDYPVVPADEVFSIDRIALSNMNPFSDLITLEVNRADGAMTLRNTSGAAINDVQSYSIASPAGGLNPAGWAPIAGGTNSSSNTQLMQSFSTAINLANGQNIVLSSAAGAWLQSPIEDLNMVLTLTGGATRTVNVNFIENGGARFAAGDLNFDGSITAADYLILTANAETSLTGLTRVQQYRAGDLGGDGFNSIADFVQFKTLYEQANGSGSFAAMLASVPEPNGITLWALAGGVAISRRRKRPLTCESISSGIPIQTMKQVSGVFAMPFRWCTQFVSIMVAFAIAGSASNAAIFEDFLFNEPNGTLLSDVENSANLGNNWLVHANTVESTTFNGSFRVNKQSQTGQAANSLEIANIVSGKAYLVVDVAGWSYTATVSSPMERMRFAFLDNDPAVAGGSTVTAEMNIDRLGSALTLRGEALGNGSTALLGTQYSLPLVQNNPLKLVLELDKDLNRYSVYYQDGSNPIGTLGTGNLGERSAGVIRDGRSLRFAFTGTYGDTDEFFDVDRIYLTDTNPLSGVVTPATLTLEVRSNGQVYIKNETANPISFDSYRIASSSSSLNFAGWNSLADQGIDPYMGGNDPGETWVEAGGSSDAVLSESFLLSATTLAPNGELSLGNAYKVGGMQDLTFQYRDILSGALPNVVPTYVTIAGVAGDYNIDGTVNAADYTIWRDHLNQNFQLPNEGGITPGVVNQADYDFWKSRFGATSGSGSASPVATVPEPASAVLALTLAYVIAIGVRPRG